MDEVIPKKIWQTYKTTYDNLPDYAASAAKTWQDKNPDWEYNYFSDDDVMDFVISEFGMDWVRVLEACPVGVMKADIWRVMILYVNGGMYTDLDTVCNVPISAWFDKMSDKRVIFNAEHELHIQQWTFLSEAKHPILGHILSNIYDAFKTPDYTNEHFVHAMTGPGIFTKSILEFLDMWSPSENVKGEVYLRDGYAKLHMHEINFIDDIDWLNQSDPCINNGIHFVPSLRFFHNEVSSHLYGSQVWNDGNYKQWIFERDEYASKNN